MSAEQLLLLVVGLLAAGTIVLALRTFRSLQQWEDSLKLEAKPKRKRKRKRKNDEINWQAWRAWIIPPRMTFSEIEAKPPHVWQSDDERCEYFARNRIYTPTGTERERVIALIEQRRAEERLREPRVSDNMPEERPEPMQRNASRK